jgi:DNA-binding transcriptional MerR regulator
MLSIGEFSRVSGLPIKTIRLYHEKGILPPAVVSEETGYRYYDDASVERARVVRGLRGLEFSLAQIAEILELAGDEADIVSFLERQRDEIAAKLEKYEQIRRSLETIITNEREAAMAERRERFEIEEKQVESLLVAGIRGEGAYSDAGKRFARLGRAVGRHICGKALNLYYDGEYKAQDADFESCFPVRRAQIAKEGITVHTVDGGRCFSLLHRGPYESIGRSYQRIFEHLRSQKLEPRLPTREVYIKGPGMIFKGNPARYLTEIQVLVQG